MCKPSRNSFREVKWQEEAPRSVAQNSLHPDPKLPTEYLPRPRHWPRCQRFTVLPSEGRHLVFIQMNAYSQTKGPEGEISHVMKGGEAGGGSEA